MSGMGMMAQGLPPQPPMGTPPMPAPPAPPADAIQTSTNPDALAQVIAQAIAQARSAGHAELDAQQEAAASAAQVHPAVTAMMAPPPDPGMQGTGGGAFPPGAGDMYGMGQ